jgi:hypothetical protein
MVSDITIGGHRDFKISLVKHYNNRAKLHYAQDK